MLRIKSTIYLTGQENHNNQNSKSYYSTHTEQSGAVVNTQDLLVFLFLPALPPCC